MKRVYLTSIKLFKARASTLLNYCVAVMVMSKLKAVMPLMLDETVRFSTAWTDAPTAST